MHMTPATYVMSTVDREKAALLGEKVGCERRAVGVWRKGALVEAATTVPKSYHSHG